ncbi:MAG: class I SAM-dependent methyltransferase [Candidatus Paceibacterota bacterium]|jgi:SAM-dependent methyltransferase
MLKQSKFLVYFVLVPILQTFQKIGIFDALKTSSFSGMTSEELAKRFSLKEEFLGPLCDFLALHLPEYISKQDDRYVVSDIFYNRSLQNNIFFSLAYEPIFANLSALLNGEKDYGVDVERNGMMLSMSSEIYNTPSWRRLCEILATKNIDTVIDLGCSTGHFLRMILDNSPTMRCFGVEIDKDVVRKSMGQGQKNNISIINGDIARPNDWRGNIAANSIPAKAAFIGITVWHEFLYFGEQRLLDILKQYKSAFPGYVFIVVEYDAIPYANLAVSPEGLKNSASVYQLIHPLTLQGDPKPKVYWELLFKKANIAIQTIESIEPRSVMIVGVL